jgi:hypothetical protein
MIGYQRVMMRKMILKKIIFRTFIDKVNKFSFTSG